MKCLRTKLNAKRAVCLLEEARQYIEDRSQEFVCHAISYSGDGFMRDNMIGYILKREIGKRLGGCVTVSHWLFHQRNSKGKIIGHKAFNQNYRRFYRMRWIDSMIQEIKQEFSLE